MGALETQSRMPSTHLSLHYHIVFGTKNHEPMIQPAWREDLHAYLGGIIRTADGIPESVGGVADHVHLLIGLRATHRLADVLREIKAVSSGWVHNEIGMRGFAWQEGYGKRFSVRSGSSLHRTTSEPSSHAHVSGRVSGIATPQRRGI
jgi:REP-associated tyrosine transposase